MPKNETISSAEKLWKKSAAARKRKVVEKAAIILHSYYHLKKRSEELEASSTTTADEQKIIKDKLATLQGQLEEIEKEVKRWRKDAVGDLEQTLAIDRLTKVAFRPAPDKSATGVVSSINKLKSRNSILEPLIEIAKKNAADPDNIQSVWEALVKMAKSDARPAPLTGYAETEGILYLDEKNLSQTFSKLALAGGMRRRSR